MRRTLQRCAVALAAVVVFALALELGTRVFFPLRTYARPRILLTVERRRGPVEVEGVPLLLPSTIPGVRRGFRPGLTFRWCYDVSYGERRPYMDPEGCVTARLNEDGQRGPRIPRERLRPAFRIVFLGDSFTFGHGVPYELGYVPRLRAALGDELARRGSASGCEAVNLAVSGFDTRDVLQCLRDEALGWSPDLLVYGFYLNDVFVAGDVGQVHGPLQLAYEQALYGPPAGLARVSVLARRFQRLRARGTFEAVAAYDVAFAPESPQWHACRELLAELAATADRAGVPFLLVLLPELVGLDARYPWEAVHDRIVAWCRGAGIEVVDVLPALRGLDPHELWVHPTDQHPNEIAHARIAAALEPVLAARLPRPAPDAGPGED